MPHRLLLVLMVAFQVIWVAMIWITGSVADPSRLPWVLITALVAGAAIWRMQPSSSKWLVALADPLPGRRSGLLWVLCPIAWCAALAFAVYQDHLPDESRMLAAAAIVTQKGVVPFLKDYGRFRWLGRQHPPLMPTIYGLAMRVLGPNVPLLRVVPVTFLGLTIVVTYLLGRELYGHVAGSVAALLLVALPYSFRWGTGLLTDTVMLFFPLALLLVWRVSRERSLWLAAMAGVIIGAGILTKYTMVFIFPVILLYFVAVGRLRESLAPLAVMAAVAGGVVLPWVAYGYSSGIFQVQARSLEFYTRTMSTGRRAIMLEYLLTNLPSGIGVFNLPMIALGGWHALRRRGKADLFLLAWIGTVAVILLLTMPDPRYFMITFPALAILMARSLEMVPQVSRQAILLALCYCGSALYLYVGAVRAVHLFHQTGR